MKIIQNFVKHAYFDIVNEAMTDHIQILACEDMNLLYMSDIFPSKSYKPFLCQLSSVSQACRKRRLKGRCVGITVLKSWSRVVVGRAR